MAAFSTPPITKNFENAITEIYAQQSRVSRYRSLSGSQRNRPNFESVRREAEARYMELWFAFFEEFGTHYIDDMITGSRYRTETFISKEMVEEARSTGTTVSTQITVSINVKKIAMDLAMAFATGGASLAMQAALGGFSGMADGLKDRVSAASERLKKMEKSGIGGIRGLQNENSRSNLGSDELESNSDFDLEGGLKSLVQNQYTERKTEQEQQLSSGKTESDKNSVTDPTTGFFGKKSFSTGK